MIAIVVSRADRASEHVGEQLLDLAKWTDREDPDRPDGDGGGTYYRTDGFELRTFDDLHIYLDDPAPAFTGVPADGESATGVGSADGDDAPDLLVFVSRHSGETGPLLTGHFTGNFGPAAYGGAAGELAATCPNALSRLVEGFDAHAPDGYDVGIECTHHGPTDVSLPSLFAELGSDEAEWDDPEGARAVARAVLDLRGVDPHRERQFVGFGGGHYAPRFERLVRETPWAVGHVGADWQLEAMGDPRENRAVLRRAVERSRAEHAVVDGDRPALRETLADLGVRVVGETWVREVGDRPLDLVRRLESTLATVDAGLRFGDRDADGDVTDLAVVSLPAELLAEANGIAPDAVREAVAARAVAFDTEEGGTRVAGDVAVRDAGTRAALVDALAAVLERKYDAVERTDGAVVVRETAFDPEKARTLGVEEGPAFGRLADGQAVEVRGERIAPETVHSERVREFPV